MTPEANAQADEVATWLLSADARAAAASDLRRVGLHDPTLVDDVLGEVAYRVTRRLANRGEIASPEPGRSGVVAYARRVVRNEAIDLVRSPRAVDLDDFLGEAGDPSTVGDATANIESEAAVDAVRASLQAVMPRNAPWAVAAGLVVLALADDPSHPVDAAVPRPEVDDDSKRWRWAGLHFAGRHDCFPRDSAESGACRMRRSRALARVGDLLEAAWEEAGDGC